MSNTDSVKNISVYMALCLIWGSTWLAIRISLESLTPMVSAGYRFVLAAVFIVGAMKLKNVSIQKDKYAIGLYLYMGFFSFVIPFGLVYWAEQFVPSGLAAVLFGVYPFFVALFSYLTIPGEKIGMFKISGMILGFLGIFVIFSDNFTGDLSTYFLGMAAVVLSAIMQATVAVAIKKFGSHLNPLSMNFVPMAIAGVCMLAIGYMFEDTSTLLFDTNAIGSVVYLAFFGSLITFTSYYWLLKRINIVILSLIAFITPIVALFLGWIFYDEQLSTRHFIGSAMVLSGLLTANLGNLKKLRKFKESKNDVISK